MGAVGGVRVPARMLRAVEAIVAVMIVVTIVVASTPLFAAAAMGASIAFLWKHEE